MPEACVKAFIDHLKDTYLAGCQEGYGTDDFARDLDNNVVQSFASLTEDDITSMVNDPRVKEMIASLIRDIAGAAQELEDERSKK